MVSSASTFGRLASIAWVTALMACQGSDLTLPGDSQPSSLREVSGSGQRAPVGSQLPEPLVVKVVDGAARPVSQVSLRFATQVPGAQILASGPITTDDSGYARVRVRLGDTEGTQTFDAQVADAADLKTTFAVTAIAPPPEDNGGDRGNGGAGQGDDGNDRGSGGNGGNGNGNGGGNGNGNGGDHDDDDDEGGRHGSDEED